MLGWGETGSKGLYKQTQHLSDCCFCELAHMEIVSLKDEASPGVIASSLQLFSNLVL